MGKGKVRKKKKARGTCETCSNAVYCGEGSHFCMESKEGPKCVMDDWGPAEDYFWCGGRKYEEQEDCDEQGYFDGTVDERY